MSDVRIRGVAGPVHDPPAGLDRRLSAGERLSLGEPATLRFQALGEGVLLVEPLVDGVLLDGRPLLERRPLDLAAGSATLRLADGSEIRCERESPARLALSETPGPDRRASPAPALLLSPAPPAPAGARLPPDVLAAGREVREARRFTRRTRWWRQRAVRIPRSVALSTLLHATLAVLVALLMAHELEVEPERAVRVHVLIEPPPGDVSPEAKMGTTRDDEDSGDHATDIARSAAGDADPLAVALDAESGRADDPVAASSEAGVGAAPAGTLLAARTGGRERLLLQGGGDEATEGALTLALRWLARHQAEDGSWNAMEFGEHCTQERCSGLAEAEYPEAATALGLLPFLGAGHTHRAGPWRETVRDGVAALLRMQRRDGSFARDGKRAYASALATLALVEAYGLTGSQTLREPSQRSVTYWVRRQSERGGWRYDPGDGGADSSITGWVAMALASARRAGLDVPQHTLRRSSEWFQDRTDRTGAVGYVGRGQGPAALLGVGLFVRIVLGADPRSEDLDATASRLETSLPQWPGDPGSSSRRFGRADPMHWYYGALGAFQRGGSTWTLFHDRLRPVLLDHQERTGCETGSWPPAGTTGEHGGRLVTTALCALSLEVYYRYPRATGGR